MSVSIFQFISPVCVCVRACACLYSVGPMDFSPQSSSVRGIFQARIPMWLAISSSGASSQPRYQTCLASPALAGRFLTTSATWEAPISLFCTSVTANLPFFQIPHISDIIQYLFFFPLFQNKTLHIFEASFVTPLSQTSHFPFLNVTLIYTFKLMRHPHTGKHWRYCGFSSRPLQ